MSVTIFLSSVSAEFGELRKRLAILAERTKTIHVRHQDDFVNRGVRTLQQLEEEIERSDAVFHVIGKEAGAYTPSTQVTQLLNRHDDFATRFPDVVEEGLESKITYTQWEAWLAIYHEKRLCSFLQAPEINEITAPRTQSISNDSSASSQRTHWTRLNSYKYYPKRVGSSNNLYDEMVLTLIDLGILSQLQALTVPASKIEEHTPHASLQNRFASFDTVCPPDMFVGRRPEISKVVRDLRSTIFVGDAKTGKTNLLHQVRHELQLNAAFDRKLLMIFLSPSPTLSSATDVFKSIRLRLAAWLATDFNVRMEDMHDADEVRTILRLLGECEAHNRKMRLVLLIDDLNMFAHNKRSGMEICQGLRDLIEKSPLEQHVTVIAASTPEFLLSESGQVSTLAQKLRPPVYLTALSPAECAQYVNMAQPIVPKDELTSTLYRQIYEATGGNPYLLWSLMLSVTESVMRGRNTVAEALQRFYQRVALLLPLFKTWLTNLSLEEMTYLMGRAMDVDVTDWPIGQESIDRFRSIGLIEHTAPGNSTPEKSCALFYSWLEQNCRELVRRSKRASESIADASGIAALLSSTVRAAIGASTPRTKSAVVARVQAILAAHSLVFVSRDTPDFLLPPLQLAIHVELVQTRGVGQAVERIQRRCEALADQFPRVVCLCYDLSGVLNRESLIDSRGRASIDYVIVKHKPDG